MKMFRDRKHDRMKFGPYGSHTRHMGRDRGFGPMGIGRRAGRMGVFLENIESKEEALDFMEIQKKLIQKRRRRLARSIEKTETMERYIDQSMAELKAMDEFSADELKKVWKKAYREFLKETIDEDDF